MKRGAHHSPETRDRIRATHLARVEQTRAAAIARASDPIWRQRLRAAIDTPEVRQRISERTKQGTARWREARLQTLLDAWRAADKHARAAFLREIGAGLFVSAP
jgi:hypothetical protein